MLFCKFPLLFLELTYEKSNLSTSFSQEKF
jgi:hypothetical protein